MDNGMNGSKPFTAGITQTFLGQVSKKPTIENKQGLCQIYTSLI